MSKYVSRLEGIPGRALSLSWFHSDSECLESTSGKTWSIFVIEVRQIFSYFYNVHALNNVISYSVQPEYHILYIDSFLVSKTFNNLINRLFYWHMIQCRGSKCLSEPKSSQTRTILNEAKYLLKTYYFPMPFIKTIT
jgi:hypothetical protein